MYVVICWGCDGIASTRVRVAGLDVSLRMGRLRWLLILRVVHHYRDVQRRMAGLSGIPSLEALAHGLVSRD
jgi:hypothetical protein